MNILYFVNYFPPSTGAAALNSLAIAKHLVNFGHKVLILAPGDMGKTLNLNDTIKLDDFYPSIKVKYSNRLIKAPLNIAFSHFENMAKFIIKIKKSFSPDLILSQYHTFHYASVCAGYTSKILKIPHIIRSHDIFFDLKSHPTAFRLYFLFNYPIIYRSIRNCKTFTVTTSEMKKYLLNVKKLQSINFKLHHNGIDITQFHPSNNQEDLKNKYSAETIISFVGLMTEDIGVHNFIRNFSEIVKNYKDTHLILIGGGAYQAYILNLIKKLKLNNNIHFLGVKPHNEIPYYINNSDIGIGRITHKIMWKYMIPVKCLEYMACKKSFLTTTISEDIIKNDDVGLILKKNFSDKELINKMCMLIEDKSLRNKLGEQGFKKINEKFRWEEIMKNFNKDLETII